MKNHIKKYAIYYEWAVIILLAVLTITFVYLGYQNKQKYKYEDSEIDALLTLRGDIFIRMIQIQLPEEACTNQELITLSKEQMKTYGFDNNLFSKASYELKCEENTQKIIVNITGSGNYANHELKEYSN